MPLRNKIKKEILELSDVGKMIQAYQEIAAMRMRRTKEFVLQDRAFLKGLNDIYNEVYTIYDKRPRMVRAVKSKQYVRKTNNKTVFVLLSANTGLYGNIVRKTFDLFSRDLKRAPSDVVIAGKFGRKFFEEVFSNRPFKFFDFEDAGLDIKNAREILRYVLRYENIIVYHGLFENILEQKPVKTVVTGTMGLPETVKSANAKSNRYIFEPSLEEIVSFFENEILSSIFNQSTYEANLSKFASRMISLDRATVSVKNQLGQLGFRLRKAKHRNMNMNQLNRLSGISLWGKLM